MLPLLLVVLAMSGVGVGFVGALIGIGGSALILPVLIFVYGLDPRTAIGTTLAMAVFTAVSGTAAYHRQKRIDVKLGLIAAGIGIPAAVTGAYATQFFSGRALGFILGVMLSVLSLRWIRGPQPKEARPAEGKGGSRFYSHIISDTRGDTFSYTVDLLALLPLFAVPGFLAGFLGIGGGGLLVQIMTYFGVPIHVAVATAMLTMIPMTISGSLVHLVMGNVSIIHAVILGAGIVIGTQLGANLARRLSRRAMERVFGYGLFIIGIWLAIRYIPT